MNLMMKYKDEYAQRKYLEMKVKDICQSIVEKGEHSPYEDIFQLISEEIEQRDCDV